MPEREPAGAEDRAQRGRLATDGWGPAAQVGAGGGTSWAWARRPYWDYGARGFFVVAGPTCVASPAGVATHLTQMPYRARSGHAQCSNGVKLNRARMYASQARNTVIISSLLVVA